MRRFGEPRISGQKYKIRPGVYAILPLGNSILLTHQDNPIPKFQLPGGGVDPGESPLTALYREVMEETGWRISTPRRLGAFRRFVFMPKYNIWAEKICTIYSARPVRQIGAPSEDGHHAVWTSPKIAEQMVENPGDKVFIQRFF